MILCKLILNQALHKIYNQQFYNGLYFGTGSANELYIRNSEFLRIPYSSSSIFWK
jgi:hypothetical protein